MRFIQGFAAMQKEELGKMRSPFEVLVELQKIDPTAKMDVFHDALEFTLDQAKEAECKKLLDDPKTWRRE